MLGIILFNNPSSISAFINLLLGVFFTVAGGIIIRLASERIQAKAILEREKNIHIQTPSIQPTFSYAPVEQKKNTLE